MATTDVGHLHSSTKRILVEKNVFEVVHLGECFSPGTTGILPGAECVARQIQRNMPTLKIRGFSSPLHCRRLRGRGFYSVFPSNPEDLQTKRIKVIFSIDNYYPNVQDYSKSHIV